MNRITTYFRNVNDEFRKVIWPTRQIALLHTLMVLAVLIVATILIALIDYGFANLFKQIIFR